MFDMQKIGRKIASLRKEKNMTQMELADKLGISFQAVSNWERGNSMPDIAKLPELAEIFGVSLNELLGEKSVLVEAAIDDRMVECMEEGAVSTEEMESVLPLLKPSQVSGIAQNAKESSHFDMGQMVKFLPFMSGKDVREFAEQVWQSGDSIRLFLPFMDSDSVRDYAMRAFESGESIREYLPFMNGKDVKELALLAVEKGEQVDQYLPFMNEEDVKELALKVLKGEI